MTWLNRSKAEKKPDSVPSKEAGGTREEVQPPWVVYPGVGPEEFFWREAGEPWKTQIWEPYYNALNEEAQAEYLARWSVPQNWREGYFDKDWREFWDHVDDPD